MDPDERRPPTSRERLGRSRPERADAGALARVPRGRLLRAYALAIALPVLTAVVLVPFRDDHASTAAIVLVVPVVVIGTLGATGPAVLAALVSGLAFDVLLVEPYNRVVIDDPDEVVAMVALMVVGVAVGVLASRLVRLGARASSRGAELDHLITFATSASDDPSELVDAASRHVQALLDLDSCAWTSGAHDGREPVLLPGGGVMGYLTDLSPDRAQLPPVSVLPVTADDVRLGCFVLTSRAGSLTSLEERRTAATIAHLLAGRLSTS